MNLLVKDSRSEPSWTMTLMMIPFVLINAKFVLGWFGIGDEVNVAEYAGASALVLAPILARKWVNTSAAATVEAAAVLADAKVEASAVRAEAVAEERRQGDSL